MAKRSKADMPDPDDLEGGRDEKGRFTSGNIWTQVFSMYGGRPRLYETPEELLNKGIEFFDWANKKRKGKITESGLRLYLGFTRKNWGDYKRREEFEWALSLLEQTLEDYNEQKLGWGGSTQGAIFWLKNKAGWKDEVVQNQNQNIQKVEIVEKKDRD